MGGRRDTSSSSPCGKPLETLQRRLGDSLAVCTMYAVCVGHTASLGVWALPVSTHQLVHRGAAGNCIVMELGDLSCRPGFQGA